LWFLLRTKSGTHRYLGTPICPGNSNVSVQRAGRPIQGGSGNANPGAWAVNPAAGASRLLARRGNGVAARGGVTTPGATSGC